MSINIDFLNNLDSYIKEKRYRLVNSVVVYQNDELIFERYYNKNDRNSCHYIFSISKSILSLALGICIDKGLIKSIDEPICRYIPQFNEGKQPYHKLITIKHLLTMSSGIFWTSGTHYNAPMVAQMQNMNRQEQMEHISDIKMKVLPGTKHNYGEWEPMLLSEIILKASGMNEWHICYEFLYKPLGMKNIKWDGWLLSFNPYGNAPMNDKSNSIYTLSAHNLAKIGLLILHKGKWNEQQIISEEYLTAALSPSEMNEGYGYYWWLYDKGYKGIGFGGQELNINLNDNSVAVVQATATPGMKGYSDICENIFWDNINKH